MSEVFVGWHITLKRDIYRITHSISKGHCKDTGYGAFRTSYNCTKFCTATFARSHNKLLLYSTAILIRDNDMARQYVIRFRTNFLFVYYQHILSFRMYNLEVRELKFTHRITDSYVALTNIHVYIYKSFNLYIIPCALQSY
jgi:hypothetical protein